MPLTDYGVLVGQVADHRREGGADSPHYQLHLRDGDGGDYRGAVNVLSKEPPSELLYLVDDDLRHPVTDAVDALAAGWHPLAPGPGGANLDLIRGNLVDPALLRPLPPDVDGPANDVADVLDHYVRRAADDPRARVCVFGQRWGPEPDTRDKIFGFRPGNGVHDVHMNQGNSPAFRRDDGVWRDGGLLLHFPGESRWVGIFLAFQSQAWHTDDVTGHAVEGAQPQPGTAAAPVRVLAALVNPTGPAPEDETVLLLNPSPLPVDLTGWRVADRQKRSCGVPAGVLPAGATLLVHMGEDAQLRNKGGAITLLDGNGLKVDGVAYTSDQAGREGWTLTF
jgi:uncharacterized protein YukJ